MNSQSKSLFRMGVSLGTAVLLLFVLLLALNPAVQAAPDDSSYQTLPFSQNWSDTNLITTNDDWSGVAGIIGYLGDNMTALTGADPQTILIEGTSAIDVIANQTNPNTLTSGGVAEFEITDPVVAFQGSGTADAPFLLIHLDTTGVSNIQVAYNLRDIDGSADNAIQPVALQYRVGNSGDFTNLPDGFVADATEGPSLATLVTPVTVTLPAAANNQPIVQIRIITANAAGSDEWVGVDDISITSILETSELSMSKSVDPATAVPYQSAVTYTVVLSNSGSVDETAVLFTDTLPISTTFGAWVEQPAGAAVNSNEITWSGTVTNGEAITFTFTTDQTADYGDTITNTAEFSGTTTGSAQAAFTVESLEGDITFVYHDLEDVVQPGEAVHLAGSFNGWAGTTPMTADAANDTFTLTLTALTSGNYEYKYVVYTDTVPSGPAQYDWLNTNNRSYTVAGNATVLDYRNVTVGYAVLSGPGILTTTTNVGVGPVLGQVYINNVTNPDGAPRGVMAQVGFGNNTDPATWTWTSATHVGQSGNNDIFDGNLTPTAAGVYSFTNRFNGNWGASNPNSVWTYGDLTGVGPYPGGEFSIADTGVLTVTEPDYCAIDPSHFIHEVQGSGASSPIIGQAVTVQAVVVSNFQGGPGTLNGFHIQEEDDNHDTDPATSEGIFVFNSTPVSEGDLVHVAGNVAEFNGLTQLSSAAVTVCSQDNVITPTLVTLPLDADVTWERFEGMLIEMEDLTATDNFRLGRFGQVRLATHRLAQPTNVVLPGAPAIALQALNNRSYITLDDARTLQNVDPMVYPAPELTYTNTLRGGDQVAQVIGVIDHFTADSADDYRLQPTQPVDFTAVNVRQERPDVGGTIQVASFNVLNYFSTIDAGPDICGPLSNQDCRGADSALEFERQYTKIVNAIVDIDAAVVGLMEIENHAADAAVIDLVNRINVVAGGVYTYVATGPIGTDAIKQAIIYQPALVTPVGDYAILDSSDDPRFDDTRNRPVIIQTFEENSSGERFTVAVNHLKSKGSCPGSGADADQGDGQGCWNPNRTSAAEALVDYLADPNNDFSPYTLIIGDLNAYALEDPIRAIETAGYTNLVSLFGGLNAYGYQFDGQWGYLDHGLASDDLLPFVTGAVEWHINADEPIVFDYNTEFKTTRQIDIFFSPEPFRSSDHDPVMVGLSFAPQVTPTIDILTPTNGQVFTSTNGTAVSVPIIITTTDFIIPADGYWRVSVDGVLESGPVTGTTTTIDLLPGEYEISVELYDAGGTALGIVDSVTVTVNVEYFLYLPVIMKP